MQRHGFYLGLYDGIKCAAVCSGMALETTMIQQLTGTLDQTSNETACKSMSVRVGRLARTSGGRHRSSFFTVATNALHSMKLVCLRVVIDVHATGTVAQDVGLIRCIMHVSAIMSWLSLVLTPAWSCTNPPVVQATLAPPEPCSARARSIL